MDNPMLTARLWEGNQPLRLIIDRNLRLSKGLNVFDDSVKTIVFTEKFRQNTDFTEYQIINFNSLQKEMMEELYKRNIHSIIIEGGRETLQSFIDIDLWDEARVFVGSKTLSDGVPAPQLMSSKKTRDCIATDQLVVHFK